MKWRQISKISAVSIARSWSEASLGSTKSWLGGAGMTLQVFFFVNAFAAMERDCQSLIIFFECATRYKVVIGYINYI